MCVNVYVHVFLLEHVNVYLPESKQNGTGLPTSQNMRSIPHIQGETGDSLFKGILEITGPDGHEDTTLKVNGLFIIHRS